MRSHALRFSLFALALLALLATALPVQAQSFSISGVRFDSSAYLSEAELQEIAAPYLNRAITFDDLMEMVDQVNRAYTLAGVVTAQAVLPPQNIVDGTLQVRLVEAMIEEVDTAPLEHTNREFITSNITLPVDEQPDFDLLERELRVFEVAHDFRPVLSFGPGQQFGYARVEVGGDEPPRFAHTLSVDNFGSPSTGEYRLTYFGRWSSVTGRRDILSLQVRGSQGARSVAAGYSLPAGGGGGRLAFSLNYAQSEVISDPFSAIDLQTDSASAVLSYSRPFWVQPDRHWQFSGELTYEQSESTLSGIAFENAQIYDVTLGVSHQRDYPTALLAYAFGLRAGKADLEDVTETEGSFALLFGNLSYARRAGDWGLWTTTAVAQFAHRQNLPYARLLSAGGATSVRGYPNAVRSGDSGLIVQTQVSRARPWVVSEANGVDVTPFGFFDAALIVPYREDGGINSEQDILASFGAGARIEFPRGVMGSLSVGMPLRDTLGFKASGPTAYFALDWTF